MDYKKTLIAIPAMDMMHTATAASLFNLNRVDACKASFLCNMPVAEARNMLAGEAIDTGADRVLWIDSDMVFGADLMEKLSKYIDDGMDFITGMYLKRHFPTMPLVYKEVNIVEKDGASKGQTQVYTDYPKDQTFEIAGSGFGAVMTTTKMLKDVFDTFGKPFTPFVNVLGEDLSFCWRARQLGYKLYCDSSIKLGHVGQFVYTEKYYQPPKT